MILPEDEVRSSIRSSPPFGALAGGGRLELVRGGQPELAVDAEVEPAAVVAAGEVAVGVLPDHHLARRAGLRGQAAGILLEGEAGDPGVLRAGRGVVEVEVAVGLEVRVERDVEQAALLPGVDVGELHQHGVGAGLRIDDADLAGLRQEQHPVVGGNAIEIGWKLLPPSPMSARLITSSSMKPSSDEAGPARRS